MKLVIGLGNPGLKYKNTRHNIGFNIVEYIANECDIKIEKNKFKSLLGEYKQGNERVTFMKPQTYMNLSGEAVGEFLSWNKMTSKDIVVIYDDISLDVGILRIKQSGSAGGHNGIKSIIQHLKTDEFPRIKIGIGEKPKNWDLADYVLSNFSKDEMDILESNFENVKNITNLILEGKIDSAMNKYNTKRR
ncbi:aminoacyl-tRNA hydrolase [Candidatus Epulonipiscium fishelsonii]|uniref:Aminoacyl-tRNA hydrolase n=1 Tax=Candidatus Epulonipiscium fishelsonii TaxID=77094 RepID=A0ACC8X9G5_9FIRM|nr:aminoacyl-tRNA hydrolase [Epulopiscium sp. SCG-B05WGA-EpuloA1]ONI38804.1 aminoacyl-tRNA hydrolase [Epulopiscium sp. SCG-B11WGA-EpuloA1]